MAKEIKYRKGGRWTDDDYKFIQENADLLHWEDIANRIGKNPQKVKQYIEKTLNKKVLSRFAKKTAEQQPEYKIKRTMIWKELEKQFSPDELSYFIYEWERLVGQFKSDILPTEESQIVDYIRMSILMNRLLKQEKQSQQDIRELENELAEEKSKDISVRDNMRIDSINMQISARRAAQENITKEHLDLFKNKSQILVQLKATRDARIKNIDSQKESYIHWIRAINVDNELRHSLGIEMEKLRLSMINETRKLGLKHTYIDGKTDLPLLNHETVTKEENNDLNYGNYGTNR